jgi:hypothetical protein
MSVRVSESDLAIRQELAAPPPARACSDQSFEMPTGVYVAMALLLFGFLAVLAVGLAAPGIAIPMAINFVFLTAFFAIPAIFVGTAKSGARALSWSRFMARGIQTETGRASGGEATVLVLLLPALIFCWAVAIVTINALV